MRRMPQHYSNQRVRPEPDKRALARLMLLLLCGVVLAGGFITAVGQHATAVEYGYRSERLREQRERLLEEQQRLLLASSEAVAPERLEQAARKIGLQPVRAAQVSRAASRARTHVNNSGAGTARRLH